MNKLFNILSLFGSFLIVFGILFLVQELTIGKISIIKNLMVFYVVPFRYLVFTATSLLFILKYINFYIPTRSK